MDDIALFYSCVGGDYCGHCIGSTYVVALA